jgi:uncharacterized membrane protein YdfJ with MMPL/SSD domain
MYWPMQRAIDRLIRLVARRRRVVLGLWIVLLVAALPFAAHQTEHLTAGGFEVPGSGSLAAADALSQFPSVHSQSLVIVFDNEQHNKSDLVAAIDRAATGIRQVKSVSLTPQSIAYAKASVKQDTVLMPLVIKGKADNAIDAAVDLRKNLDVEGQAHAAVPVHVVGQQALWAAMQDVSKSDLQKAETSGFPIVLIVLLAIFGSVAAAALPLVLGFVAVILTGGAIFFLSQSLEMSVFVTNIASMLGIGVAVDYSLFILARYREEIRLGATADQARETAMRTSGLAVAVSGVTVMISLAGLFLIDSTMLRSMAVGAIVVVAIAILAAVTLLPAVIQVLGQRVYTRGRVIGGALDRIKSVVPKRERPADAPNFWTRWTSVIMRRPVVFAISSAALMLIIAIPATQLKWGTAALAQLPSNNETRVAFEHVEKVLGPGALGPVNVVAEFGDNTADTAVLDQFRASALKTPGVKSVAAPLVSKDGHTALVVITPTVGPETPEALDLIARLRAPTGPAAGLRKVSTVDVGGVAAENKDFTTLVSGSLWKLLLFVLLFSYLVLLVMLRSVILPLKAVVMNLLTVAAAYGVLVMVFQYGWFDSVLGFHHLGYINAPTPPLLLAIVFGLSMDYEVFLLSRIRERYQATGDNRTAVAEGLAASAQTISSAAVIMVLVFAVFALTGLPQVKEIGVGLSAAIFLDATLVRLVLVPATMELMGKWNWWLPKPLARWLPDLDLEGGGAGAKIADPQSLAG